jgi:2-dehydro-3-deoxy-D-arabinonate dehydratase
MDEMFLSRDADGWVLEAEGRRWRLQSGWTLAGFLASCTAEGAREALLGARGLELSDLKALRAPLDRQEVWAAGVTYKRSEEARERESGNSNVYTRVYHASRPELFFKSLPEEVVAPGEPVGIRADATWSVPEPELALLVSAGGEVIGFTLGNDMSSRDIEGENPLYLPQAKVYEAACALGPRIWIHPSAQWVDLEIGIRIVRGGATVFEGTTSTAAIHRTLEDLVEHLTRCKPLPHGAVLLTGTGIVPPDEFTLHAGDEVRISSPQIGELVNPVRVVGRPARWRDA